MTPLCVFISWLNAHSLINYFILNARVSGVRICYNFAGLPCLNNLTSTCPLLISRGSNKVIIVRNWNRWQLILLVIILFHSFILHKTIFFSPVLQCLQSCASSMSSRLQFWMLHGPQDLHSSILGMDIYMKYTNLFYKNNFMNLVWIVHFF